MSAGVIRVLCMVFPDQPLVISNLDQRIVMVTRLRVCGIQTITQ